MKISLSKRWGWVQVRGGRVVRVAQEHAVQTDGRSVMDPLAQDPVEAQRGQRWVTTRLGDLAVELVAVKNGNVLGHSYLTGPAIQLNRYTPFQADWFVSAVGRMIELPLPDKRAFATQEAFFEALFKSIHQEKYGADLLAFEYFTPDDETARRAADHLLHIMSYEPAEPTESEQRAANFIGTVHGDPCCVYVHWQPPEDAQDSAVSAFQTALVLDACQRQNELRN